MANYTPNYQLHQWEPQDPFLRTDFNQDLFKIDTALGKHEQLTAANKEAITKLGNCQVVTGTYVGEGRYGDNGSNSLTFSFPPMMVIIQPDDHISSSGLTRLILLRDGVFSFSYMDNPNSYCRATWNGNTVTWNNSTTYTYQCDTPRGVYRYVAFLNKNNQKKPPEKSGGFWSNLGST